MKPILESVHLRGAAGAVRVESHGGLDHLVLPCVALIGEQVIHAVNSPHAEKITTAMLVKAAASFEQKPVVLNHPVDARSKKQISANSPDVLASHGIGLIKNSHVDGTRLLCEAWIDPTRAEKLGGVKFVEDLRANLPIDVSVGAYVVVDDVPGELNGKRFASSWVSAQGDHVAVLYPNGVGACAWTAGCGLRAAQTYLVTAEGLQPVKIKRGSSMSLKDLKAKMLALFDSPEDAAAEEKAELIAYQSMRDLFDAAGDQWDAASSLIDDLIADEEENPTSTPAQEQAEEEVETARLDAIRMHCYAMMSAIQSVANACVEQQMPDAPEPSDPRYMAGLRAAIGKSISAKNMGVIQKTHDASHDMHSHTVALGAECNGMKLLAAKPSCETCDGTGQTKIDGKQEDCAACDGSGILKAAAAAEGVSTMTPEQKTAALKALVTCGCDEAKIKALTTDDQITAALLEQSEKQTAALKVAADAKAEADAKFAAAEAKLKAASEHTPTEEEWLKTAPASFRAMHAKNIAEEAAEHAGLVAKLTPLKTLSEADLKAKSLTDLRTLAAFAKVETQADYSGRGVAMPRAAASTEDFTPPNPYDAPLKALQGSKVVN